jgi:uncharacterized protein (UPF0248 family)
MRRVEDVFNRIKWDDKYNKSTCIIGYLDRFDGVKETPFSTFDDKDVSSDTFIPWHRIQFFKLAGKIVWDRRDKTNLIFGEDTTV